MDLEKEIFGNSSDDGENLEDLDNEKLEEMFASSDEEVYKERVLPSFKKKKEIEKSLDKKVVKKRRPKEPVESRQPENQSPEELKREQANRDVDEALERIKPRGRKRDLKDETVYYFLLNRQEWDEKMNVLLNMMKEAAYQDLVDIKQDKPGLNKMKLLPSVLENLRKRHLHSQFLDNSILDGIKLWLEPLDIRGAPFPNIKIQKALLLILDELPIETHHLRSSTIGRIVKHYTINPRIMKDIQAIALKLVDKWIRPIIQRSSSYRDAVAGRSTDGGNTGANAMTKDIPRAMNEKYRKIQARMRTLQSKR